MEGCEVTDGWRVNIGEGLEYVVVSVLSEDTKLDGASEKQDSTSSNMTGMSSAGQLPGVIGLGQ